MKIETRGEFSVQSWNETTWEGTPLSEQTGRKQTHAVVTYAYEGEVGGTSTAHYLMSYNEDSAGTFVGMERFSGSVGGREGTFVLQLLSTFDAEGVTSEISVVPGTGSGELSGISGSATASIAGHRSSYPISFRVVLPD